MHANQLAVSAGTVRELVGTQFPAWRRLTVRAVKPAGTVNAIFRIGDELVARFPLRPGSAASVRRRLESEVAAARELAGRTWAFEQAMGLVWYYAESNPAMSRLGRRTLDRILASTS